MNTILSKDDSFFKGKPYTWEGVLFPTVAEFESYLVQTAPLLNRWARGVTVHHTWRPTVADWSRNTPSANLKGLVRTWRDENGWSTGPNMVIGPEGIYLASGITAAGIHATICNSDHVGIEVVGNYDNGYWQEPIRSFVIGAVVALAKTLRLSETDILVHHKVNGHRECNSPKTCPGSAIDLDKFRRDVVAKTHAALGYYEVAWTGTVTRTGWSRDFPIVERHIAGQRYLIDELKEGQEVNGLSQWAHRADQLGFIHIGALRKV